MFPMVKVLKWLINLAKNYPILFAVALLLIGLSITGKVIIHLNSKIETLQEQHQQQRAIDRTKWDRERDSMQLYYNAREDRLNAKTEQTLREMLEDYRQQVKEQNKLRRKIDNSIANNEEVLKKNKEKLNQLNYDY